MQLDKYPDATFRGNLLRKYFRRGDAMNRARSIIIDMTNQLDRTLEEQKSKIEEVLENHGCECGCLAAVRSIK